MEDKKPKRVLNKEKALKQLGGVCIVCGTDKELEFDHIRPFTRRYYMSSMWSYSWKRISYELIKCQLLCREHHLEKTRKDRESFAHNWHRAGHGYYSFYVNKGCRCSECRAAYMEYCRDRRNRIRKEKVMKCDTITV